MQNRIKVAIEFLKENQSFLIGDLRLGINVTGGLQVIGWSRYTDFRNLSKATCLEELREVKQIFFDILKFSEDLQSFIKDKDIEYCLNFDDYGKASIVICSEKLNYIKWYIDLK